MMSQRAQRAKWRNPTSLTPNQIERWHRLLEPRRKKDALTVSPPAVYYLLATIGELQERTVELEQQRNAANHLLMELAEDMKQALALLRDYVRIYPNNSGRPIRFLKRMEEVGLAESPKASTGKAT